MEEKEGGLIVDKMKMYRGVQVWCHSFLTSKLDVGEWLVSRLGFFTLCK